MPADARCCRGCSTDVSHRSPTAQWCSEACRARTYRDAHPEYVERQGELARVRNAAKPGVDHPPRACQRCGEMFKPAHTGRLFCSRNCSNASLVATSKRRTSQARDRAERRGFELVDDVDVGAVFDRCAWICGLCDDPVDPDLRYPDPLSASLDHIVPKPFGGRHEDSNVQLAHLVCNKRKGNRLT